MPLDGRTLRVDLPSTWRLLGEHAPTPTPALPDVEAAALEAMRAPIGCAPFAPGSLAGKRVAIVVDDVSRPTPVHRFFRAVVAHLEASGARREDLCVVFALDVHRPMTEAEAEAKLGKGAFAGIAWHNHDARDPAKLVDLGTTSRGTRVRLHRGLAEVDLVVTVGAIEPHLLLGFGGGLKILVPGLAAHDTIAQNHMQGVSPDHFNYVGELESPMRLDLEEAALLLKKPIFILNACLNEALSARTLRCGARRELTFSSPPRAARRVRRARGSSRRPRTPRVGSGA